MMLKGIPNILSPDLLKILMEWDTGMKLSLPMAISRRHPAPNGWYAATDTVCQNYWTQF